MIVEGVPCSGSENAQTPAPTPIAAGEGLAANADRERALHEQTEDLLAAWRGLSGAYGALSESPAPLHEFLSPSVPEACSESGLCQDIWLGETLPQPHHRSISPSMPAAELAPMARAQLAATWHPQPEGLTAVHPAFSDEDMGMSDTSLAATWDAHSPAVSDAPCWHKRLAEGSPASMASLPWPEQSPGGSPALVPACWHEQLMTGSPAAEGSSWHEDWSAAASPDTMAALWATYDGSHILMVSPEQTSSGQQPLMPLNHEGHEELASCMEQLSDQHAVDCLGDAGVCVLPDLIRPATSCLVGGNALPGQPTEEHGETITPVHPVQPTEQELHAVMARFREHCLRLPHGSMGTNAAYLAPETAGLDALLEASISVSQQGGATAVEGAQQGAQSADSMGNSEQSSVGDDLQTDERPVLRGDTQPEATATDADQPARDKGNVHLDSLQPGEASFSQEEASQLHLARLVTCSDEEDFAVLDLGADSDSSSECSFGRDRAAAGCRETIYAAPRYAFPMQPSLHGPSPSLPASCQAAASCSVVNGACDLRKMIGCIDFSARQPHFSTFPGGLWSCLGSQTSPMTGCLALGAVCLLTASCLLQTPCR